MALTDEYIKGLIKDYLESNSITLSDLDTSDGDDVWVFGTQEDVNGEKKSVRIKLSDIKGKNGETTQEVSVYKRSDDKHPDAPAGIDDGAGLPPEGWLLKQGSKEGVWWVSKGTFVVDYSKDPIKYGRMIGGWSIPYKITVADGDTMYTHYRYYSSKSSIQEPPMDTPRTNIKSPGDGWEKDYKLVDDPSELQAGIAVYNTEANPPVYLWETKAVILNNRSMHVPWSDPILKSAYGGSKGDTPILDPILNLSANSGHMMCDPDTLDPLPNQNITITAKPQNFGDGLKDAVFKMVSYDADGQPIGDTSLSSTTETTAVLTSADWLNTFARVEITCTVSSNDNISRSASVIIHRQVNAKPGENAMLAYFLPPFMNIPAHSDGTVPRPNYEEERSYFNLISGNEIIIDKNTSNSEIEFIFEGGKLGFEVAIVENGIWKSNIHGMLSEAIKSDGTLESDGTLKIIDFPPGSDNMNIIVKARYKDGSIHNGSASASFSLSKNKESKEPDSPLDNSDVKSFINILTKGYVQPTLYIKPSYIESDTYQKDDYVPNKIIDGDNVSWTPSGSTWYSKKQSVGPIWDHQWVSERTKTNGVWGAFDPPILRNNYPKPPIDTTETLNVILENDWDNFYRKGNSADVFVRAFLGNTPKTPTMIRVDDINGLTGTYDDLFDFEINNDHQRITFTLNENVNTRKNGKIPINTIVEGQERVLYFRYSIIPSDSEGGGGGGFLMLSVSSNVMDANVDNSAKPGQVITIEAKTINVAGDVVFNAIAYTYNGDQLPDFMLEPTDVSSKKRIRSTDWVDDIEKVVIEASIPDTNLFDIQTIYKYSRTPGSITGHLTNPHITLYPGEGGVTYFGSAIGEFHVFDGGVRVESGVTFSEVNKTGRYNVVLDETTGKYSVDEMTDDNATVTLRAKYESTEIDRILTLRKSSDTIITADSAFLKTACTSNTITRDVTSPSNHKDSDPKIITVEAIHINVDNLKWLFKIDGARDYIENIPQGVSVNDNGDILTITTEELTEVSTSLGIKVVANIVGKDVEIVDYENIQIIKTGQNLIPAKTPVTREWVESETHRNNIEYVDYIYYRDFNTKTRNGWFKLTDEHSEYTAPASPYDDSENTTNTNIITIDGKPVYEKIEGLETKAFDLVLAEEANLAGFVFKNNILYSQNIKTEDSLPEQFLMLNGHDGKIKAQGVEIEGEIKATSGEIGNFTLENGYLVGYDNRYNPAQPTMGLNANANIESRDDNLAFWAGGSFNEVSRYVDNYHSPDPNFVEEDVAYITHSGRAFFSKADIKGRITATRGTIGGFTLGDNFLTGYDSNGHASMGLISNPVVGDDNVAFWVGSRTPGEDSGDISTIIKHDGTLIARNANITGNITSQSLITRQGMNDYISLNEVKNGVGDNMLKFRYPNGNLAAKFGLDNNEEGELVPAMIWYDENGVEIWRAGKDGLKYVSYVSEHWRPVKMFRVATLGTKKTLTSADNTDIANGLSTIKCSDDGTSSGQYGLNANVTYYYYTPGVNPDAEANEQYRGLHTTQEKSNLNWIPSGWYVNPTGYLMKTNSSPDLWGFTLYRYDFGKLVDEYFAENVDLGTVTTKCPVELSL